LRGLRLGRMESEQATRAAPVESEATGPEKANEGAKRRLANLSKPAKGTIPEGLKRYQEARRAGELPPTWSKSTLMECVNRALRQRNGAKLIELAESIVDNAVKGNSACLTFLAERLAPIEEKQGGGRVVFEGIKLEVVGGAEGTRTSIALVRGSESHSGASQLDVHNTSLAETVQGPRDTVVLEPGTPETPG